MARPSINIEGKKYGRLKVVAAVGMKNREVLWECLCDCGSKKRVPGSWLRNGSVSSCGCLRRDIAIGKLKKGNKTNTKHGESMRERKTAEYRSWESMKYRCEKSIYYTERGIKVCKRWMESFHNFLSDVGRKPTQKHSLDRINNDGNYEPGNVRWATPKEQANNRRRRRKKDL